MFYPDIRVFYFTGKAGEASWNMDEVTVKTILLF